MAVEGRAMRRVKNVFIQIDEELDFEVCDLSATAHGALVYASRAYI